MSEVIDTSQDTSRAFGHCNESRGSRIDVKAVSGLPQNLTRIHKNASSYSVDTAARF
jgi:hypothetical protein